METQVKQDSKTTSEEVFATQSEIRIFITNDYDKFELSEYNRDPSHYKKLLESIKKNDYTQYQPILVDKNLVIVDGQNRFLACKELGKPIHFIVSQDIHIFAAADINQASKNWNVTDYARHYAKRGNPEYIRLLDICHKYDQRISVVMAFGKQSGGVKSHTQNVKSGNFEFKTEIDIDDFFEHIRIFEDYYTFAKREKFIKAMLKIYIHENYDKKKMENKLRQTSGIVKEQPRVDMMTEELLKLYNYRNRKPIHI